MLQITCLLFKEAFISWWVIINIYTKLGVRNLLLHYNSYFSFSLPGGKVITLIIFVVVVVASAAATAKGKLFYRYLLLNFAILLTSYPGFPLTGIYCIYINTKLISPEFNSQIPSCLQFTYEKYITGWFSVIKTDLT
jgi:hypothetical protein